MEFDLKRLVLRVLSMSFEWDKHPKNDTVEPHNATTDRDVDYPGPYFGVCLVM
jgi:hypothetical protein